MVIVFFCQNEHKLIKTQTGPAYEEDDDGDENDEQHQGGASRQTRVQVNLCNQTISPWKFLHKTAKQTTW